MPPDIIDIIIKAIGQLPAWLQSVADIVLKATPAFGLSPFMIFCGFLVLVMGWDLMHERG